MQENESAICTRFLARREGRKAVAIRWGRGGEKNKAPKEKNHKRREKAPERGGKTEIGKRAGRGRGRAEKETMGGSFTEKRGSVYFRELRVEGKQKGTCRINWSVEKVRRSIQQKKRNNGEGTSASEKKNHPLGERKRVLTGRGQTI